MTCQGGPPRWVPLSRAVLCTHIYIYTYIHMYMYTYTYISIHVNTFICTYVHGGWWPISSNLESSQEANGLDPPPPVLILEWHLHSHLWSQASQASHRTMQLGTPLASDPHLGSPPWQLITEYMSVGLYICAFVC